MRRVRNVSTNYPLSLSPLFSERERFVVDVVGRKKRNNVGLSSPSKRALRDVVTRSGMGRQMVNNVMMLWNVKRRVDERERERGREGERERERERKQWTGQDRQQVGVRT
jgi:hypothetical protein